MRIIKNSLFIMLSMACTVFSSSNSVFAGDAPPALIQPANPNTTTPPRSPSLYERFCEYTWDIPCELVLDHIICPMVAPPTRPSKPVPNIPGVVTPPPSWNPGDDDLGPPEGTCTYDERHPIV